jgi:hypothetical protein
LNNEKPKAGRKPKLTDEKIASIFKLSFITGMPSMKIVNQTLNSSIKSYHIFRNLYGTKGIRYMKTFMFVKRRVFSRLKQFNTLSRKNRL